MKNPVTTQTIATVGKAFVLCALTFAASPLDAGQTYWPKDPPPRRLPAPTSVPSTCASETITIKPGQKGHSELVDCVRSLEALRSKVEEWGTVTISAPVAAVNADAFAIPDEILNAKDMFERVIVERNATVAQANERAFSARVAATVNPSTTTEVTTTDTDTKTKNTTTDDTGKTSTTKDNDDKTSTTTTTTKTIPPSTTVPALPGEPDAKALGLGSDTVTAPFGLVPSGMAAPSMSVGDAMRQTNNNLVQQKIYSQLTQPKRIEGHSRVIFCLVQVSCNPGWRTKENYIGDCSASLEYYNMESKKHLPHGMQRAPKVFSVLPLLDAHTVEMANSEREVTSLALQLAGSLAARKTNISANSLFQFVKRFSRDMRSVTPMPVVNSYSSGGTFGFRFSPSFQALRDPAQKNAKAANVLLPRSFPALITVVLEDEDLDVAAKELGTGSASKTNLPKGFAINTHVSTRWYLKDRPKNWEVKKWIFDNTRRDTVNLEVTMAQHLAEFYQAKCYLKDLELNSVRGRFSPVYEELRRQVLDLECKGLGRDWPIPLEKRFFENVENAITAFKKTQAPKVDPLDEAKKEVLLLQTKLEKVKLEVEIQRLQDILDQPPVPAPPTRGDTGKPASGQAGIEEPGSETAAVVDEKELRLDDTLLLPRELQNGTFPTKPLPPLPAGPKPAPRKQVAKATPAPAPPAPKKAAVSVLRPHLALDRTTPPLRR